MNLNTHDFEYERRRQQISNSQPLEMNWVGIASFTAACFVGAAILRVLYLGVLWLIR